MTKQLHLIEPDTMWRLDEETRQIGRRGLADAREALRSSRPQYAVPDTQAA